MAAPSLPRRLVRLIPGLVVVLSLAVPLHGPGHGMAWGPGAGGDVAADRVAHPSPGGHAGHHDPGDAGGDPHHPAHQASGAEEEGDRPVPLCLCCPGPCACPPALALRATGERFVVFLPAPSSLPTSRVAEAPPAGPVPYHRPWPTAPPSLPLRG